MKVYATFNSNGYPTGFYLDSIYGPYSSTNTNYPTGATEISIEDWQTFVNNQGNSYMSNGTITIIPIVPTPGIS